MMPILLHRMPNVSIFFVTQLPNYQMIFFRDPSRFKMIRIDTQSLISYNSHMKKKLFKDYRQTLMQRLQNPELAILYLNEALKEKDQRIFLLALKDVLEAKGGGLALIAKEAQLNRQNLYRIFSKKGNPRWDSLTALFNVLGLQVHLSFKNS